MNYQALTKKKAAMNKKLYLIFLISFYPFINNAQINTIHLNGKEYYINGVNIPWNNFGWDFGEHHIWGEGYDSNWFKDSFKDLQENGVNCVRIWIHCDGRANPNFDEQGYVTGLDNNFLQQLNNVVKLANEHSLMVILTLWSHDMLEDYTKVAGKYAGLHADLIKNKQKTNSYIQKALIPIVKNLKDHCNILAWEIMNEPEWGMNVDYGGTTQQTVSKIEMQQFIGKCIEAIREHTDQNITIGSAKPFKNNSTKNYWHESEFHQLGFNCSKVYLDFYSFHFYNYMGNTMSPHINQAQEWKLNKPILISEVSFSVDLFNQQTSPLNQQKLCKNNGYGGIVFWSYKDVYKTDTWTDYKKDIKNFTLKNTENITYNNSCENIFTATPLLICKTYPNPSNGFLNLSIKDTKEMYFTTGTLYNMNGKLVKTFSTNTNQHTILLDNFASGVYYLLINIYSPNKDLIYIKSEKVIIENN
ncbi:putative Cellulase family glycosylhydrolase [Tenacibaculum sp. 190524A02b]|uniref:Cellulase family glycosylhydrolase n=2 Tax=Tenacibaculum vairaonense TaxID=3137860 RepID=A0ABM9PHE9_9FLAO